MMHTRVILPAEIDKVTSSVTLLSVRKLLRALITIQNPGANEGPLLTFIENYLRRYGLNVKRQHVGPNRYNLIASGRNSRQRKVLLNTHVDTVPSHNQFVPRTSRRANYIYGRGACDAKGSVAAMLLGFISVNQIFGPEHVPVDLCLTVGEESSGDGSLRFVRDCRSYDWAIVGEPTDLRIVDCHAGFVEVLLSATSARSHAFHPIGEQAIIAIADLLLEIRRHVRRRGKKPVHLYVPWIDIGEKTSFWSTRPLCNARVVVNTYSRDEMTSFIRFVQTSGAAVERKHEGVRVQVEVADSDEGLQTAQNSRIIKLLSSSVRAIGRKPTIAALPSWTDGSRLRAAGIPTIVFGPGSLQDAHTDHEKVRVVDVKDASIALTRTILAWYRQ